MYEELNNQTKNFIDKYLVSLPCWGILTLFYNNPSTYGRAEDFARWTGLDIKIVEKALKTLTKKGLLNFQKKNNCYTYQPKREVDRQIKNFFDQYEPSIQRFYVLESELNKSSSKHQLAQ